MLQKELEFWIVLVGMVLYVAARDAELDEGNPNFWALARRLTKVASSALLAVGLAPTGAPWVWGSEIVAAVVIMGFGQIALDALTAIVMDREFIKDQIKRRLGGGGDDRNNGA